MIERPNPAPQRLAELVAALSFATDVLLGQPMEHALRTCVLGMRIGERAALGRDELAQVYWVSLLAWIGCSHAREITEHFGDDIKTYADSYRVDGAGAPMLGFLVRHAGAGGSALERVRQVAWVLTSGAGWAKETFAGKCEIAEDLAGRLKMDAAIRDCLQQVYERWDGKGDPRRLAGERIAQSVRVFHLAEIVEAHHTFGGFEGAVEVARARRGTQFDPALVDLFLRDAGELLEDLGTAAWDRVIAAEPAPHIVLGDRDLDEALEAIADFVGLKSPLMAEHSRGVAALAEAAATRYGLPRAEAVALRRAGLVHDLGRMGVSNAIWEKRAPLSDGEREHVRLHAYMTERMLARSFLSPVGALASLHHERCDGSGYHRGLDGATLSPSARLLAAADTYHAMLEERPHRPARSREEAADALQREARAGRIDGRAAESVLEAAGHRIRRGRAWPAGLSDREVEVLRLLARGRSKRDIARALFIAPATADHHVRHIYTKAGVTTRAGATLFAMRHGLLDPLAAEE